MPLLTPGYWPDTYWAENYWNDLYWQNYGVPVVFVEGEVLEGSSLLKLTTSAQSLLRDKIERGSKVITILNRASPL